jgi:capsular exopolysaccharide synthesis family protein
MSGLADQHQIGKISDTREFVSPADIASFLKRHFWVIAGSLLVGIAGASLYLFLSEPIFTARSQLLIDPKMPQPLREQSGEVVFSIDNAQVESQMAVLRSEKIATTVIDNLNLKDDPEFLGGRPSILTRLRSLILAREKPVLSDFERFRQAMGTFEDSLEVRRSGLSYAIDIAFSSLDPEKAARIANAMADAYIRDQIEAKSQTALHGSEWLEERMKELRVQMNSATLRVQEFRAKRDYSIRKRPESASERDQRTTVKGIIDSNPEDYTLEELQTTADTYRRVYESFLQALTTAVQRQSFPVSDARVITQATRPLDKSHPRSKLILALGAMLGLVAGVGIAVVRDGSDGSVRSSQQIRDQIGLECLSEIPCIRAGFDKSPLALTKRFGSNWLGMLSGSRADDHFNEVERAPLSCFSGSLKSLKTAISLANRTRSIRSLGLTSALPGEGKSTVASNLAALFSKSGLRTLIVDADTYNSTLTKRFASGKTSGLIDALGNISLVAQCIVQIEYFDLLPAVAGPIANSNDMLGSNEMQELLASLSQLYDVIIVDLPPLKPAADARAISPLLDSVIVVAEWGRTPLKLLSEVSRSLRNAKASILGVVMTKVDESALYAYGMRGRYYRYFSSAQERLSGHGSDQRSRLITRNSHSRHRARQSV